MSERSERGLAYDVTRIKARATSKASQLKLWMQVRRKWENDKRHLPLKSNQWDLYWQIHRRAWLVLRAFPDLVDCRDFNDRIQWLKLFDQNEGVVTCSDKLGVRDYVKDRLGEGYLTELYQVGKQFSDLIVAKLPEKFVVKANHDSGSVWLVEDKIHWDALKAGAIIDTALGTCFGWTNGEWAYSLIEPRVFVEEFIDSPGAAPPADYKFQCVNGEVRFCRYTFDRGIDTKEIVLDADGRELGFVVDENFKFATGFQMPSTWDAMKEVAETLSRGFKCVRVDLYSIKKRIIVGEMTFFPMAGYYKGTGQLRVGHYLDFDRSTFKDAICHLPPRS